MGSKVEKASEKLFKFLFMTKLILMTVYETLYDRTKQIIILSSVDIY